MSHGYFYICDQCDKHKRIEPVRYYKGTYYEAPDNWITVEMGNKEIILCSKRCAKAYARDCE